MVAMASGSTDGMKALVQDGSGSADVLHLREIGVPAVTDDRVLVNDLVRPLGADELVDYTQEDVAKREERYDVILDVAAIRSLRDPRRMLVPGGTLA